VKTLKYKPILCLELLKTFSSKEMENLSHLVNCRYFNTDKYVVDLLNALKRYKLGEIVPDDEFHCIIYGKIFPHLPKPINKLTKNQGSQLNRKMNDLLRLAEQLLTNEELKKNHVCKDELLYPPLLRRKQFLSFNRHINREEKILSGELIKDERYYARRLQMELNRLDYLSYSNKLREEDNLSTTIHNLERYYLLNKLSLHMAAWSIKATTNKEYDFIENSTQKLPDLSQFEDTPMLFLYAAGIELAKTRSTEAYQNLLNLLEMYHVEVPALELRNFYTIVVGFCISKINSGSLEFGRKIFEIYKTMHEKNLLIEGGFISIGILKNVVKASCNVGEFEWAEKFIVTSKKYIIRDVRESVCQFNYGTIAFLRKDFEAAHNRFIQVDKIDMFYDINVRVLILKCLYEKEKSYNEATAQAFRTTERFLKKHQSLTGKRKKAYKSFIQILINLYRIRHNEGKRTLAWLKTELEQQQVNSDKRWLLEKIEELEKK